MNIAQAAAAGLLKVPGKETPTQIPAQPSVNVPAQPSAKVPAQPLAQTATNPTVPTFAFGATATSTVPAEQKTGTPSAAFTAIPSTTAQVKPFAFQGSTTSAVASTTGEWEIKFTILNSERFSIHYVHKQKRATCSGLMKTGLNYVC